MRRLILLVPMLASLTLGVAAPAAAAERDARIVSITPGFRQELVDITSLTYDRGTGVARLTLTVHCFVGYWQADENTIEGPFISVIEFGPDAAVVERSKPFTIASQVWTYPAAIFPDSSIIDDAATPCVAAQEVGISSPDHTVTFTFPGLSPGYATFVTSIHTGIFSGHVTTTTLIRAVLPSR
jgi:hypothetical protein